MRKRHMNKRRSVQVRRAAKSFWSGMLMGLSAVTVIASAPTFSPPRQASEGLRSDWRAIGSDLRQAMRRINGKEA